jgi:hypothetical protein
VGWRALRRSSVEAVVGAGESVTAGMGWVELAGWQANNAVASD